MLKNAIFAALVGLFASSLAAQTTYKYGHMNLGNLVEQLPEVKKSNDELKAFAEKLSASDDSLTKSFQADYEKFAKDYQSGLLKPVESQQMQAELEKRQQYIQAFEQDAQKQIADKRDKLLTPILDKVKEAVKVVAKENGYAMIFDTSSGAALYALETIDVTDLVKKKLGVQ